MTFEEICNRKGGKFTQGVGCLLDDYVGHNGDRPLYDAVFKQDFPHRTDSRRLFYETTKLKCEKNGDEFVYFGAGEPAESESSLPIIQVCRELGASEYCEQKDKRTSRQIGDNPWVNNWHKSLEVCMSTVQFPDHKLEGFFETHDANTHLAVIKNQVLHPTLITTVMQSATNDELATLYEYQALNPTQVDTAIRNVKQHGKGQIRGLCKNKKIKFTEAQIDALIKSKWASYADARWDLDALYSHYTLTSKQVDDAIVKGISIDVLIKKNRLTDAQTMKIIKTFEEGSEIFELYSKKGSLKPKHIDFMLGINADGTTTNRTYLNYIALVYKNQKMSQTQISRALEISIDLETIYLYQKLDPPQVTQALKHELGEASNIRKNNLFAKQVFTDANIDSMIEHAKTQNDASNLTMFMELQRNRLTKTHLRKVIDCAHGFNDSSYNHRYTDDVINSLFQYQAVDVDIINYCIDKQVSLEMIYTNHGGLFKKTNIDNAIKVGKHVGILYLKAKLTNTQIMAALKKKDEIGSLIQSEKTILNEDHIRYLIRTGSKEDVEQLYGAYNFNSSTRGKKKTLSEKNIDAAMERAFNSEQGDGLHLLYLNNTLSAHQLTRAVMEGKEMHALYCNTSNVFSDADLKYAILNDKELANLYSCQTKLPSRIINLAMEHRMNLHELYEHQKLTSKQLLTALSMGLEIQQLITNHLSSFKPEHFDVLIPNADDQTLYILYRDDSYQLSDKQRETISKRFKDKTGMDIPAKSLVHKMLDPKLWLEYETKKQRSIDARIPETPFASIIGTYSLALTNPWQDIIDVVKKEGYRLSPDGKHAIETDATFAARQRATKYPIPDDAPRLEYRVGRLLRKHMLPSMMKQYPNLSKHELEMALENSPLMREFQVLESQHIRPLHFTEEFTDITPAERDNLEIVITNDPNAIAAKGAGTEPDEFRGTVPSASGGHVHIKTGCETVKTGAFGWKEWTKAQLAGKEARSGGGCGWCDDIKSNNVIAILQHKGTPTFFPDDAGPLDPKTGKKGEWRDTFKNSKGEQEIMTPSKKWYARAMIRWCVREDNKKVDAILETVYGGEPVCKCHGKDPKTADDIHKKGYVTKYRDIFKAQVTNILRANGFTAKEGDNTAGHKCNTPYHFTGYADKATQRDPSGGNTLKTYHLAE